MAVWGALVGNDSRGHRLQVFRSLAANRTLLRVLQAYVLFILTEYSVWIAMLVFAYDHGGATIAGLVAVAQLVRPRLRPPWWRRLPTGDHRWSCSPGVTWYRRRRWRQ